MNVLTLVSRNDDNEPTTTSEIIAKGTQVQHKNVMELIRDNLSDFEEFGQLAFETRVAGQSNNPTRYARLNEPQATLLLTYMRNSEIVKDFKKRLVHAFFALRKLIAEEAARTAESDEELFARALPRALQSLEATKEKLAIETRARIEAQDLNSLLTPLANAHMDLADTGATFAIEVAGPILGSVEGITCSSVRLWALLKALEWVWYPKGKKRPPVARQDKINKDLMHQKPGKTFIDPKTDRVRVGDGQARLTVKGLRTIYFQLKPAGATSEVDALMRAMTARGDDAAIG